MKKNYYIVEAKCGHVGRLNYVVKRFPTKACSASEAAAKARQFGRVKHHWKSAIVSVNEVSKEEYEKQIEVNTNDPYFAAKNIQDQRTYCLELDVIKPSFRERAEESRFQKLMFHRRREKEAKRFGFRDSRWLALYSC